MQDVHLYASALHFSCLCEHFKGDNWVFGEWPRHRIFCRSSDCLLLDRDGYVHTVESGCISGFIFYESITAVEMFGNNENPFSRDYDNYGQWIWFYGLL